VVSFLKAVPLGLFLTLLVALLVGSGGSSGGVLNVIPFSLGGVRLFWSWPLFCLGTALAWALLLMTGD
jgi:hypothetical protein